MITYTLCRVPTGSTFNSFFINVLDDIENALIKMFEGREVTYNTE